MAEPHPRLSVEEYLAFERRALDSLAELVLVAQERIEVEQYSRQPGGKWLLQAVDRLEDTATLASIGCEIPLAALYERIF